MDLTPYPVVIETPVAWGEMDAFQHVNNSVYFRYFESARIAYFRALELMDFMEETGVGPILAATSCRFKMPLTYPDTVEVATRVPAETVGEDRFTMEYVVVSRRHDRVAARGEGEIVSFDYRAGKKVGLPEEVRRRIAELEGPGGAG